MPPYLMGNGMKTKKKPTRRRRVPTVRKRVHPQASPQRRVVKTARQTVKKRPPLSPLKIPAILLEGDPLPEVPAVRPPTELEMVKVNPAPATESIAVLIPEIQPSAAKDAALPYAAPPAVVPVIPEAAETMLPHTPAPLEAFEAIEPAVQAPAISPTGADISAHTEAAPPRETRPDEPAGLIPEPVEPSLKLWLTPRDPHSLLASWVYTRTASPGHPGLYLRVYEGNPGDQKVLEQELPAEVSHRFVQVGKGNTFFSAQIGYYAKPDSWVSLADSDRAQTPADVPSELSEVVISRTIDLTSLADRSLPGSVQESVPESARIVTMPEPNAPPKVVSPEHSVVPVLVDPSAFVPFQAGSAGDMEPRVVQSMESGRGAELAGDVFQSPESPPAVAKALPMHETPPKQRWVSSLELAGHSAPGGQATLPEQSGSVSSPLGGKPAKTKDYWLVAEVELVVYGATEPGSKVTLAGIEIPLRSDGSFTCRLSLPVGQHDIPIHAVSPDGSDSRQVRFGISRA